MPLYGQEPKPQYLEGCGGDPFDADVGRVRPCPLRSECKRYSIFKYSAAKGSKKLDAAPYDFSEHKCDLQVS